MGRHVSAQAGIIDELRPAIEFAFHLARAEARDGGHHPLPPALKPLLRFSRLPTRALDIVREIVDVDDAFRERVLDEVSETEVGELGWIWLSRPDGWLDALSTAESVALDASRAEKAEGSVKATRKRLDQVDSDLASAEARVLDLTSDLAKARSEVEAAAAETDDLRVQVAQLLAERDAIQARSGELGRRATRAERRLGEERQIRKNLESDLGGSPQVVPEEPRSAVFDDSHLAALAIADARKRLDAVEVLLDRALHALPEPPEAETSTRSRTRKPHRLGRGLIDDTSDGLRALMGLLDVRVLVDGYNVAKLGWPKLELDLQRARLVASLESMMVRGHCVFDVVFDGADVVSAHRTSRTPWVRVSWSPDGVTADDVIVDHVADISPETPVVVVTDDRDVQRRSSRLGANIVSSATLLAILT